MLALAAEPQESGLVTLRVGVPTAAGSLADIAADGASGLCTSSPGRITCPATESVTFRFGLDGPYSLVGDVVLAPGDSGVAFVLTPEQKSSLDAMISASTDAALPADRRRALGELRAWTWSVSIGTLPPDSPLPVPHGWVANIADDPDPTVRRVLVDVLRDLRDPDGTYRQEASDALFALADDRDKRVKVAATATLAFASKQGIVAPLQAWAHAVDRAAKPDAAGKASAITLAKLHGYVDPHDVDVPAALAIVLEHHPEQTWKVWGAWRKEVPLKEDWALTLLTTTTSLHQGLLKQWAKAEPDKFAALIERWEPGEPHSTRYDVIREWLTDTNSPVVRAALDLPPVKAGSR